jgi:hypothetical protein
MTKISPDKAATVGDLLCRYMRARHRFADRVEQPLPSKLLAALISQGKAEFDEIYVEPEAKPPVVLDGKAGDFFAAIIEKNYSVMPSWDPHFYRHGVCMCSATALCRENRSFAPRFDLKALDDLVPLVSASRFEYRLSSGVGKPNGYRSSSGSTRRSDRHLIAVKH